MSKYNDYVPTNIMVVTAKEVPLTIPNVHPIEFNIVLDARASINFAPQTIMYGHEVGGQSFTNPNDFRMELVFNNFNNEFELQVLGSTVDDDSVEELYL